MFINKAPGDLNNISGKNIRRKRQILGISQRQLADMLQISGLDINKNAIQRIECGKRFVTDIEIVAIANVLQLSYNDILKTNLDFKNYEP